MADPLQLIETRRSSWQDPVIELWEDENRVAVLAAASRAVDAWEPVFARVESLPAGRGHPSSHGYAVICRDPSVNQV